MKTQIYLDHAAATPVDPHVRRAMQPFLSDQYGNPSSIHDLGLKAKEAIESARKKIAAILHCHPHEIIFASGGTESINLALKGIAFQKKKGHIITSTIEHKAVLETCNYLEKKGFSLTYLDVDKYGMINPKDVEKAIKKNTILISIMYANNEVGTIQPISGIGKIAQKYNIPLHTDACQAGLLDLNVKNLSVDLMTLNGNKIYGPKGIGMLYKRNNIEIEPLIHGGGQEFNVRSGTENVAAIVGFAKAVELIQKHRTSEIKRLETLRDNFIKSILREIPLSNLNGHPTKRLPNNIHISFKGIKAEELTFHLNQQRIYLSVGSACSSNKMEINHVLQAINLPEEQAVGSIRMSLGKSNSTQELIHVIKKIKKIVAILRQV